MAAGDFSASDIQNIQINADLLFGSNQQNKKFISKSLPLQTVRANQVHGFRDTLERPDKDLTVEGFFISTCATNVVDLSGINQCAITGLEAESDRVIYNLTIERTDSFQVDREKSRTNLIDMLEDVVPHQSMLIKKALEEDLNDTLITFLAANASANQYTDTIGTIVGNNTEIPAGFWTPDIIAEFDVTAEVNQMNDFYFLSGTNLRNSAFNAALEQSNEGTRDRILKLNTFDFTFDVKSLDTSLGGFFTFMIERGAVAVLNKVRYPSAATPEVFQNPWQLRWSEPSLNVPGLMFDVIYTRACSGNNQLDTWQYILRAEVVLNPLGCAPALESGILQFEQV